MFGTRNHTLKRITALFLVFIMLLGIPGNDAFRRTAIAADETYGDGVPSDGGPAGAEGSREETAAGSENSGAGSVSLDTAEGGTEEGGESPEGAAQETGNGVNQGNGREGGESPEGASQETGNTVNQGNSLEGGESPEGPAQENGNGAGQDNVPADGENPAGAAEPGEANDPGEPNEPGEPDEPDVPGEPDTPGKSEGAEAPKGPGESEGPKEPGESEEPGETGTSEEPKEPEVPEHPEKPGESEEPKDPEEPEEPKEAEKPEEPGTGENPSDGKSVDEGTEGPARVLTLTAPMIRSVPAAAAQNPGEAGQGDPAQGGGGNVPEISTRAFTAPVALASTGDEGQKACVLQQKIDDAIAAAQGTLTENIRVVLEKDTTYDGEVKVEGAYHLELASEDAAGKTLFIGNMFLKGVNMVILGVGLPGQVTLEGGSLDYTGTAADDTVNVTLSDGASADIRTGDGNDAVNLTDSSATGKAEVDTGSGDDTVEIDARGNVGSISVRTGEGDDTVSVRSGEANPPSNPTGEIEVDMDVGMDRANVDLSVSKSVKRVSVTGGVGSDRLHITGALDATKNADQRATGTEKEMTLQASGGRTLTVLTDGVDNLTDELENKRTVKLTPTANGVIDSYTATQAFTNYLYDGRTAALKKLVVSANEPLPLSAVVIDTDVTNDQDDKLTIQPGALVDVHGLQLMLKGRVIEIDGTVKADSVIIDAVDGTNAHSRSITDRYNQYNDSGEDVNAGAAIDAGIDAALSLFSVNNEAAVRIGKDARIYSANDVMIGATVNQDGGIIKLLPSMNVVNVKEAIASVDVQGQIRAGYDFASGTIENPGNVSIRSAIKTTMGFDSDGKAYEGLPLAVAVASLENSVHIAEGASITAGGDISLSAESSLKVSSRADSGLFAAPAAIAVSVLNSDVSTTVDGSLTSLYGGVSVRARGEMEDSTSAAKGDGHESLSGGFAAVAVALQDVKAELGSTATVKANGDVDVKSAAHQNVKTAATSGKAEDGDTAGNTVAEFLDKAAGFWPNIKDKISSESAREKLEKAIRKVTSGTHSVKVDEDARKHGDTKAETEVNKDGETIVTVQVKPWAGYRIKSITLRGTRPGESAYVVEKVDDIDDEEDWTQQFVLKCENAIVFVEYEEIEDYDGDTAADLFADKEKDEDIDLQALIDDATSGANDDTEDAVQKALDELTYIELKLGGSGGTVLTYESDPEHPEKSLAKAVVGEELRLLPNPGEGNKLKAGGLKVTYKVREKDEDGKDKLVQKTIVVNPDAQNRYIFKVPEDADPESKLEITATFEKGEQDKDADTTQTQLTGAVAVTVATNDNLAAIDAGAKVESAEGGIEVSATETTVVSTVADGTAAEKPDGSQPAKKADGKAIKRPGAKQYTDYKVPGHEYGLAVDGTVNGKVTCTKAEGAYAYTVEAEPDSGYDVAGALLVYTSGGERKTMALEKNAEGKYAVDLTKVDGEMDRGCVARIAFTFAKEGTYGIASSEHAAQTILANPIRISYNALKKDGVVTDYEWIGKVYWKETGADGKYVFEAAPDDSKGYVLDGELKAAWVDADGNKQEKALALSGGQWVLDPAGIPAGALITVNAAFKEDFHDFKVQEQDHGEITLHDEKLKSGDKPVISVEPKPGYSVTNVTVSYKDKLGDTKTQTMDVEDSHGGDVTLTNALPVLWKDSEIKVSAYFEQKTIGLHHDAKEEHKDDFTLSEDLVSSGDKVTASPIPELAAQGWKISKVTVKDAAGTLLSENDGDEFEVPEDITAGAKLNISVSLAQKEIALEAASLTNGTVTPEAPRADGGEVVTVKVAPDADFRVKKGTLKAVIQAKDGSYTEEVYMARQDDTTYTFDMPVMEDPSLVTVTFTGEFEPGQSDSSAVETSLGAGIAVSVALGDNRAEIRGKTTGAGSVKAGAELSGGVKTEAKAGYSKGNIGVGGAVSVQVASLDSKALIHEGADVRTDGALSVNAGSELAFEVNADASGNKEAGKAGVGAGIAVAVNGTDATAAVADGASLSSNEKGVRGVEVIAGQKVKDKVSAKAGAAGGTAVVPVAAVDVTGTSANAYLGRVAGGTLAVDGRVAVSATNSTASTITADASAAGNGAGVGAAVGVSVVSGSSEAKLNQSVDAERVTVSTVTNSTVENTATASASGGKGKKSADGQADGLLDGAKNVAGKNKNRNVSGEGIDKAVKGRQKSETSEGSVGVAGAVAVNVQFSENRSAILDGVNVKAAENVSVTAENGTTARAKANASTTNSDIGVGVGAAVNIVFLHNLATVGDGEIEAAMLEVAANTKKSEPEGEDAEPAKVEDEDGLKEQIGEAVTGFVTDLVKEMGLDSYVSESLVGEITGEVAAAAAGELIDATGLADLLGDGDIKEKYEKALDVLAEAKDGLMGLPEKLIEPFMEALEDVLGVGSMEKEDFERIRDLLKNEFSHILLEKLKTKGMAVLEGLKDGMIEYVKDNIGDIFSGVFSLNFKSLAKDAFKAAKKELSKAAKAQLKKLVTELFTETLTALSGEIPGLNRQNIDRVVAAFSGAKDAYQQKSLSNILDSAVEYVTDTFREEVFDYEEMINTISETDFKEKMTDGLRAAAKAAMVTLTNEAVSKISEHFDLGLEREEARATGHIIETQAIAGAGAREVGVAGSVAVTVLNAETAAEVAEGGAMKVSGNVSVTADELRYVHNVASAALDADGNAETNKSAAEASGKDVGGGNDGKTTVAGKRVKMNVKRGGSASIDPGDLADDRPRIDLTLDEGYEMPVHNYVQFTYTDKKGEEQQGVVEAKKDGKGWYVDTAEITQVESTRDIVMEFTPVAIRYTVPTPDVLIDGEVKPGVVTVEAENGEAAGEGKLKTTVGDKIKVTVQKQDGYKLDQIAFDYTDTDGKRQEVIPAKSGETDKDITYVFYMPAASVDSLAVLFVEDKTASKTTDSETTAKDDTGKGVGVGAAFSMAYGSDEVKATVGKRDVTAGAMSVEARSEHKEEIASAAGSDPLENPPEEDDTKKYSVDASLALNILDNDIQAGIAAGSEVTTTGYTEEGAEGPEQKEGSLAVRASEDSTTETTASAFAVGGRTAVGASAAVNIASTTVRAEMNGSATVAGSADVSADSHSEDTTRAMASAMGADIGRSLNKLGEKAEDLEEKGNKLLDGSYLDKEEGDDKPSTDTAKKINDKLDQKKGKDGDKASGKASTSTNVLRSVGAKTESEDSGSEGTDEAGEQIKDKTGQDVDLKRDKTDTKWQVAAAVGVTVASHEAVTSVGRIAAGKAVSATAVNTGNFNTMGSGAAMSLAKHANSIAAGVAVSVNDNKAKVQVYGDLVSTGRDDVTVSSRLTQNLDGDFAGKLAAQALSGSVAGDDSDLSIGGAISVVKTDAESTVEIAGGSGAQRRRIEGGNIRVEATDKSKAAARAGGLSISKGSSVGMGIASTTVLSDNTVAALIGDNTDIEGGSFRLSAEKQAVTYDDYKNLIDAKYLVTDSSALPDEERKNAKTGLVDFHKGEDDDSYQAEINLSGDKLLDAVDGLNFLSSQNTYAEAIAGSVMTGRAKGGSKLSLAGSFAVAVANNTVHTALGKNASVNLKKDDAHTGDMAVNAANAATTRIIAGSLSAAPAKASVGATVSVLVDSDDVLAETGDNAKVTVGGDFSHTAETTGEIQAFTAAMSAAAGKDAKAAVGGAVNVIVTRNRSESRIGSGAVIAAGGSASVGSRSATDLIAISGSAAATAGAGVAAGGTVNVIYDRGHAVTSLGDNLSMTAEKDVTVASAVNDRTLSGTASLAMAAAAKGGKSGAGVANVIIGRSAANTTIGRNAALDAKTGDLKATADNDAWLLNASLAAAGGKDLSVGAAFNVNVLDREAAVRLTDGRLNAGGDLYIQANAVDTDILAGLSVAGSVAGNALSGNAVVLAESNRIRVDTGRGVTATAGKNALVEAHYSDFTVAAAGTIAASVSSTAAGATGVVVVKNNEITTDLAASDINAAGGGEVKNKSGEEVDGLYVGANAGETQYIGGAGVAASGGNAFNGVAAVSVDNNVVRADASEATLASAVVAGSEKTPYPIYFERVSDPTHTKKQIHISVALAALKDTRFRVFILTPEGEYKQVTEAEELYFTKDILKGTNVAVKAKDDTTQVLLAGGLSGSVGSGVGASVVTLVSNKDVRALAHDMKAVGSVDVGAANRDDIKQIAVSAGGSGGSSVQIGAAVQVLMSKAVAQVGSEVSAQEGGFTLAADNDTKLYNIGAAVGVSGGGAAATPVGVVTYFEGQADARLLSGSRVDAAKDIAITAAGNKDVNLYSIGAAAGSAGISGAANVLVSKDSTKAVAGEGTNLTAQGDLNVSARGNYKLRSASAAITAGQAGVGVNAVVSVMKTNTTAELGGEAKTGGSVNVDAEAKRDVISAVASLGAGQAGAGVSALVLVSGTKMSQDAADMIAYGNASDKSRKRGFDGGTFLETMEQNGIEGKYYQDSGLSGASLDKELAGNGHYESKQSVGTSTGSGGDRESTFDAASGYRSADFDDQDYNDDGEVKRGENLKAEDTRDIANAKKVNTYTYEDDPTDAVIARITETATVDAGQVNVSARQPVTADLFGAAVGAGQAGVGVSAAVAMLRSNVSASSMGTITRADRGVNVTASSAAGEADGDEGAAGREKTALDLMSNNGDEKQTEEEKKELSDGLASKLNPENRSIRAFGLAAGAGQVGVAVSAAVVLTDNVTQAILGGTVKLDKDKKQSTVNVSAEHDYGTVMAGTGALAAGMVGAAASVSVAQANGTVKAEAARDAGITAYNVEIGTRSNVGADAAAVTAGAGAAAVNAGLALAINRLTQETGIGEGASVDSGRNVTVRAESAAKANSYLLGVAVGGVGVSVNAAVSEVETDIDTYIGEAGNGKAANVTAGNTVEVANDVSSSATPEALSAAVGGVAVGGNVLLGFNNTKAESAVRNANLTAQNLYVLSDLEGKTESSLAALQAGAIAVGLSVNYADMRAENRATVEDSAVNASMGVSVRTNSGKHNSTAAKADTISGNIGLVSAAMNAAVARNNSKNYSTVTGMRELNAGSLNVSADGNNTAEATLTGLSIGLARAAATAVVALNDADTRVTVKTPAANVKHTADLRASQDAATTADILTGGGSLFAGVANVAAAYGRTNSLIDATFGKGSKIGNLQAENNGSDNTSAVITNAAFDLISASAMAGAAYSQDLFDTRVTLEGDSAVDGGAEVRTNYKVASLADVTPSAGGVKVSAAELALNLAMSKNTVYAGSEFAVRGGTARIGGGLDVNTTGTADTKAVVNSAKMTVSGAQMGANIADADLAMTEAAALRLDGSLAAGGAVNVKTGSDGAKAYAGVGTSGKEKGSDISVSLLNTKTNTATARERLASTAAVLGGGSGGTGKLTADRLNVSATNEWAVNTAEARSDGAKEAGILTAGNLGAKAVAGEERNVLVQGVDVKVNKEAQFSAANHTTATGAGYAPGSLAVISGGVSDVSAAIGSKDNRQSASIVFGDGVKVSADRISLRSENTGSASAGMEKRGAYSVASLARSSQPTESWYNTGILLGTNVILSATGGSLAMDSVTKANAESVMEADSLGLLLNADTMRGSNKVDEINRVSIGDGSKLTSKNALHAGTESQVSANAKTEFDGGFGFIGGSSVKAENKITRDVLLQVGSNVTLDAGGRLDLQSVVGEADSIKAYAKQEVGDLMEFAKAEASTSSTITNRVNIGAGSRITAKDNIDVAAVATGVTASGSAGYDTGADVDATGFKVDAAPDSYAILNLKFNNAVNINPARGAKTVITSKTGEINVRATNKALHAETRANVEGDGLVGGVDAYALTTANLANAIWVDNTDFSGRKGTNLRSGQGEYENKKATLNSVATAKLTGVGYENATARLDGRLESVIHTHNRNLVNGGAGFTHLVSNAVNYYLGTKCNGWGFDRKHREDWIARYKKCDFCADRDDSGKGGGMADNGTAVKQAITKALSPINDILRTRDALGSSTKARYGVIDYNAASELFVLDLPAFLDRDVRIETDGLERYRFWNNSATHEDVYMLPNATRLYGITLERGIELQYVAEVLCGDALGNGEERFIDVISALTAYAFENPVIPIGSIGSLDFRSGTLWLPDQADITVCLDEVSGKWLAEGLESGYIRRLLADAEAIRACVIEDADLPQGTILETVVREETEDGLIRYWIGYTPETAPDPETDLVYLLVNPETDEASAWRTSVNRIAGGEAPVPVSLYLYRDSSSDRQGIEKYNVMFYDTPAGSKSLVDVVTDVLKDRVLEMPRNMQIVLRGLPLEGVELPVYSVANHLYAMNNASDGVVRLYNDFYTATFDGDVFESPYLRIEGIRSGKIAVTLKQEQPVWPEYTGENTAETVAGQRFVRINGVWIRENETQTSRGTK